MEKVAAALYGLDLLFLLSFQLLNRDQPAFARPVSDYGLGRTAGLFRIYLIAGCIAAPILDFQGEAVAGISISGPTHRITPDKVGAIGALVRVAAGDVSRSLGAQVRP